jgi:hypothetical protein
MRAYNIRALEISMETEDLYQEVERRKRKAIDLGIPYGQKTQPSLKFAAVGQLESAMNRYLGRQ